MPDTSKITPQMLVWAYSHGIFPMAHSRSGPVDWYAPDPRAILPLNSFHVPKSLGRRVRQNRFSVTVDRGFEQVIRACAEPRRGEPETWINNEIIEAFTQLHELGVAHSIEAWLPAAENRYDQDLRLAGGLYGVALGGAFFGESMFHRATDASKVCLVRLVEHLRHCGFTLLDIQFSNPHLVQFGLKEISRDQYTKLLRNALELPVRWDTYLRV